MRALRLRHLARYGDIALLLRRLVRAAPGGAESGAPEELAAELERLGPTFVKLGQLLSTRSDLLPEAYVDALERLQDRVAPFPFEEARATVESELGAKLGELYRDFEPEPVAAASLSQIHRARLRNGRVVAVKVQRPGLREAVADDLAALAEAARFLDRHTRFGRRYELGLVVDEFRRSLTAELDFTREAHNLRTLAANLEEFPRLLVPRPYERLTTARVLTMDFIDGRKVTSLPAGALSAADGPALADEVFRCYLQQILVDGFFHADPHPGNVLLAPGGRIALLDLGMTARIGPELQQSLLALLLAISEGRSEDAASEAIRASTRREGFREDDFRARVGTLVLDSMDATISQLNLGRVIFDIARASAECGLRPPRAFPLLGKSLLNLDKVVSALDPDFEPADAVRAESARLLQERLNRSLSRAAMASSLLEVRDFAGRLPARLGKVLDVLGGKELRVKVDALDENLLIQGMQKIANRIALGVVLASLIIGATLMMQVDTTFRILEYPGLAILLFAAAALGSLLMMLDILYYDDKRRISLRGPADKVGMAE